MAERTRLFPVREDSGKYFGDKADLALGGSSQEHTILEWFGPPERNTLRPLGEVLFLVENEPILCRVLALPSLSLSSSGRPPFIDQGVWIHRTLEPRQVGLTYCAAYCAEYLNGYSGYESFL